MARETNGSSQSLQSAASLSAIAGSHIVTFSFWMYLDTFVATDVELEGGADASFVNGYLLYRSSGSLFNILAGGHFGPTPIGTNGGTFTAPAAGAWHQYIIQIDRSTGTALNPTVWIDNVLQTITQTSNADWSNLGGGTQVFDDMVLNLMARDNSAFFAPGRIAEFAVYYSLTSGQRAALQTDAPAIVGTPIYYWPICGVASPEPNALGGFNLTVNGATAVTFPVSLAGSICSVAAGSIAVDSTAQAVLPSGFLLSYTHTFAGSDRIVFIEALTLVGGGSTVTGVSVDGNGATKIADISNGIAYNSLWYYIAPPTGAKTISIAASLASLIVGRSVSYTGALQSGVPDNFNTASQSAASFSNSLTPVAPNCWIVASIEQHSVSESAASGCIFRVGSPNGDGLFDSNGPTAGSTFVVDGNGASQNWSGIMASFAPSGSPPPPSAVRTLTLLGAG